MTTKTVTGTTPSPKKPLLQTVVDILDISLDILKNHPSTGNGDIGNAENSIKQVKQAIANYKDKKGKEDYPLNELDWKKVKE